MRAVLDTNILARAVPGKTGPAREVLELLAVSPHVLVTAPPRSATPTKLRRQWNPPSPLSPTVLPTEKL
jgi:hypothetical protein